MDEQKYNEAISFIQGDGVLESGMMHALKILKSHMWGEWSAFIFDAQALCAIFMLIFFAIKSYEMMAGDKKMEVMPLLRPFGLLMVILWWGTFTKVIAYPTDIIADKAESMSDESVRAVNNLMFQRAKLMQQVATELVTVQAEVEVADKETGNMADRAWEWLSTKVKDGVSSVWNAVAEMRIRLQVQMSLLVTALLETLGLWILRICIYFIFLIQIIYSTILLMLGPFAVAVSILPAFRDSMTTWIARFISVNLYTGIGYIILHISMLFMQYALEAEVDRYTHLIGQAKLHGFEVLASFAGNGIMSFGMVIISFIIGALCILTVPSISTWIISTSGISSAASTVGRHGGSVIAGAKRAITKGVL